MKAERVHGAGAVFANTSRNVGLLGQYGPEGMERLNGLEPDCSPADMNPSSSASHPIDDMEPLGDG